MFRKIVLAIGVFAATIALPFVVPQRAVPQTVNINCPAALFPCGLPTPGAGGGGGPVTNSPTVQPSCPAVAYPCGLPTPISTPIPNNTSSPYATCSYINSAGACALPIACTSFFTVNITTATTTLVGANTGGKKWFVCYFSIYIVSGTTPGFYFETGGTGTCTSPSPLTGTYGGVAAAVGEHIALGFALGQLFNTTGANSSLCLVSTGTTPNLQGIIGTANQ